VASKNKRRNKQPKEESVAVAKWPEPVNFPAIEQQVMQSVVNNYRALLGQLDQQMQAFKSQVMVDMKRLANEVGVTVRISDDGYEIMETEPEDE